MRFFRLILSLYHQPFGQEYQHNVVILSMFLHPDPHQLIQRIQQRVPPIPALIAIINKNTGHDFVILPETVLNDHLQVVDAAMMPCELVFDFLLVD